MTTIISASTVSASTSHALANVCRYGRAVLAHEKTGQDLLAQVGQWAKTTFCPTEKQVVDWAIAQGLWQESFPKPRSLWQEVSRGKREGGKPSARWTLVGSSTESTSRIDISVGDDTFHLPLPLVAALGRLCALAANKASQAKARQKALESETKRKEAENAQKIARYMGEIAKLKYADGQDKLFAQLALDKETNNLAFWAKGIVFEPLATSAELLANRINQYQLASNATKNREVREKYALWRNKRKEQSALILIQKEEQEKKERERKEQEQVKNAILLQNYASILKSIQAACNKLPVELQPGKNKAAQEMATVLEEIRNLLKTE